jgi:hypothetical protein
MFPCNVIFRSLLFYKYIQEKSIFVIRFAVTDSSNSLQPQIRSQGFGPPTTTGLFLQVALSLMWWLAQDVFSD